MEQNRHNIPTELICRDCGKTFLFSPQEQQQFQKNKWAAPIRCPQCRLAVKKQRERERAEAEHIEWCRQKEQEQREFAVQLQNWAVVPLERIAPAYENTLYILGNGFDLCHGVKSSYYAFRDTLGKHSPLRQTLETYLTDRDIWADFEAALGRINLSGMMAPSTIDLFLHDFDAYGEDSSAADFFCAVDAAAAPMYTIAEELPKRFRNWVNTLSVPTDDRPLQNLIHAGKVLCFNYTEFVEELYDIPTDAVCYTHGCRRKKKGQPYEPLILGHQPRMDYGSDHLDGTYTCKRTDPYQSGMIDIAQDAVIDRIAAEDTSITKNCRDIIRRHREFFDNLRNIETVVVIGHSLSLVDLPYFDEIHKHVSPDASWYIGAHGLRDLNNLAVMQKNLALDKASVYVFPTDTIRTTPRKAAEATSGKSAAKTIRLLCSVSPDGHWKVYRTGACMEIYDSQTGKKEKELILKSPIQKVIFDSTGTYLFLLTCGMTRDIYLFHHDSQGWRLIRLLEPFQNQSLVNRRLRRVILGDTLSFIYNNRVRCYSKETGALLESKMIRNAKEASYEGEDLTYSFLEK